MSHYPNDHVQPRNNNNLSEHCPDLDIALIHASLLSVFHTGMTACWVYWDCMEELHCL